jgi:site-specific recombinase XerD
VDKLTFTEASERLQGYLYSKGRSSETHKAYRTDLRMFWEEMHLPEEVSLDQLEMLAARWLTDRKRIMAPKTTARRLTTMKNVGKTYGLSILTDFGLPTAPVGKPHPLPGGVEDIRKLLDFCYQEQHRVLIALTGLCGARISEARAVNFKSFDLKNRLVTLWGKGDKIRHVPISDYAWNILLPAIVAASAAPDLPLIKLGDRAARDLITTLGERAGLSRAISSHDLRATFATEAYRLSLDIRAVQELLGHATSKQTELYILVEQDALRAAVNIMENR